MSLLSHVVFGRVKFRDTEEFLEFRFRFLIVVMLSGAICTALILAGSHLSLNPIAPAHVKSMTIFTFWATALWIVLRGHKERFQGVAWSYLVLCMLEYTSALIFVPEDELRVLWFLVNVPGVYILLGSRVGALITAITVTGLALGNSHLSAPYSPNAMATLLFGILYVAVFFHFYGARSFSYFLRMRESNDKLRHMATHDTLTGVLNARAYYAGCDHLIHLAQRQTKPYAVLFVDLDHFKAINDTHGHAAGDTVLKTVAACLGQNLRQSDVLGRIGGEEFSIFLPDTEKAGALELAEKIRQAIAALQLPVGERTIRITASIGVAANRRPGQTMGDIQQQADQAMYHAKAQGRNRVSFFDGSGKMPSAAEPVAPLPAKEMEARHDTPAQSQYLH